MIDLVRRYLDSMGYEYKDMGGEEGGALVLPKVRRVLVEVAARGSVGPLYYSDERVPVLIASDLDRTFVVSVLKQYSADQFVEVSVLRVLDLTEVSFSRDGRISFGGEFDGVRVYVQVFL